MNRSVSRALRSAIACGIASPHQSHDGLYAAREPFFAHRDFAVRILLPASADELIDAEAFNRDERLPYWADLWPAAKAMARWLLDEHARGGIAREDHRIIEVGCGAAALASLALASRGLDVLASDYEPEALGLVEANAARLAAGSGRIATRLIDWRDHAALSDRFDLIIGTDLMYEQRNAMALAEFVPRLLTDRGRMLLADPGRRYLPEFIAGMKRSGYEAIERAMIEELNEDANKPSSRVRIIEFKTVASPC